MTDATFTALHGWVSAHTPSSLTLVALNTNVSGGESGGFDRGDPLKSMDYLIHSRSSARYNGTVQVDSYLSTNDTISASDRWLFGGPIP